MRAFGASDFITLYVGLTSETRHLMNRATLAKMKRTAVFVNASRGPVVDPDDLYDALSNGVLAAAALDVTEPEPIPADRKLLTRPLPSWGSPEVAQQRV